MEVPREELGTLAGEEERGGGIDGERDGGKERVWEGWRK